MSVFKVNLNIFSIWSKSFLLKFTVQKQKTEYKEKNLTSFYLHAENIVGFGEFQSE